VKLVVIAVGRGGCPWGDEAVRDYSRRLRRWGGVDEEWVRAETFRGDVEAVREAEGERLRRKVRHGDRVVALDERGEDLGTSEFTDLLRRVRTSGVKRLVFLIGGPYGLSGDVRSQAWRVVRLSSLVLNHDLARVVLYEQLYRGHTILAGMPYHH